MPPFFKEDGVDVEVDVTVEGDKPITSKHQVKVDITLPSPSEAEITHLYKMPESPEDIRGKKIFRSQ